MELYRASGLSRSFRASNIFGFSRRCSNKQLLLRLPVYRSAICSYEARFLVGSDQRLRSSRLGLGPLALDRLDRFVHSLLQWTLTSVVTDLTTLVAYYLGKLPFVGLRRGARLSVRLYLLSIRPIHELSVRSIHAATPSPPPPTPATSTSIPVATPPSSST